jgi:hypothetical protein
LVDVSSGFGRRVAAGDSTVLVVRSM